LYDQGRKELQDIGVMLMTAGQLARTIG